MFFNFKNFKEDLISIFMKIRILNYIIKFNYLYYTFMYLDIFCKFVCWK